ncbi:MAG: hypothetical protein SOW78_02580 [Clostridia bacterium]|nr:hypothetical protein [Clostridia bacterium]
MSEENRCDKIIPTKSVHIENMNEAQLEQEIVKSDRKLIRLKKTMSDNLVDKTPDVGLIPLNQINGYNDKTKNTAKAQRKYDKQITISVNKSVAYTKAKSDYDAEKKRNNALIKALNTVKGTGKTTKQIKDEKLADIAKKSTMKWEKSTQKGQFGNVTIRKSGAFVIRSTGSVFFIYKNGTQIGMTNKLRDATAFVELYNKRGENNG